MLEKIVINDPNHTDLNMYRCGIEDCSPGHAWGPAVRDHFIIHYILGGKGTFHVNGLTYHLRRGDGFLIRPNTVIYYQADLEDPWSYSWVGFHGIKAEAYLKQAKLTADTPIFHYDRDHFLKECLDRMIASKDLARGKEIRMLGFLYVFLSQLVEAAETGQSSAHSEDRKEVYIKKAVEYIAMNYHSKVTVSEIARHIGLDRSYLYSLFKEYLNASPQEFIMDYRINKACELLHNHALTIGDVSRSVGYEDPLLFSKIFKKAKGQAPREFRKQSM